jgi:hypothetical protein
MSRRRWERNAVYLITVPDDFRPQRPWELPPGIVAGELYAKNLAMAHALGFVRCFNKRQMDLGLPDRRWAIAIHHARFRWDGPEPGPIVPSIDQAGKGGAA